MNPFSMTQSVAGKNRQTTADNSPLLRGNVFQGIYVASSVQHQHWERVMFLVAPCCSQGATLQVTLRFPPVVCLVVGPWQDPPPPHDWLS